MKKVFSLALLFASVNNFFADGDTSREPVAESKDIVVDEQQTSGDALSKFFLELGVNVGAKNTSVKLTEGHAKRKMSYHFAFGGTIAPYYVINDKYSIGLEFGINRVENAKVKVDHSYKRDVTHYSYLLMLKRNICPSVYAKLGLGVAHASILLEKTSVDNVLKMGPMAKVAVGYNVWKNVDVELGYNYYRINGKKFEGAKRATSHAISAGVLVRL